MPTLEKAYEMLPGRGDVAYNLLLGYARAGKRQEAIDLVATAEARGVTEEQLAPARQTLLQLDFQYAVALARDKKLDEAAALLEKVVAESSDAGMRKQAADFLQADQAVDGALWDPGHEDRSRRSHEGSSTWRSIWSTRRRTWSSGRTTRLSSAQLGGSPWASLRKRPRRS